MPDYPSEIARLILERGNIEAQRAQIPGKGRIIATSLAQLANFIPQVSQLRQQEAAQRQAQVDAADVREANRLKLDDLKAGLADKDAARKQAAAANAIETGPMKPWQKVSILQRIAPERAKQLETDYDSQVDDLLMHSTDESWAETVQQIGDLIGPQHVPASFKAQRPSNEALAQLMQTKQGFVTANTPKPPPALVPIPGPEGSPVYGTPVPGQPVYEKPPAERPQSLVPVPGPNGPVYGTPTPGAPVYERPRAPTGGGVSGAAGGLEPDAVDYTATQYRVLGPSGIPTRIETADRVKILNTAAKQAKALGQTPAQAVQKQAAFKSDAAALNQMRKMSSSAQAYENKALEQAELVRDLSNKVPRTAYPIINGALLAGKQSITGDTDTQLLFNALSTFTAEYAKIMEGSTGSAAASSDAARRAAADLISPALAKGTLSATIDQMKKEMGWTLQGYDATINQITERMGGAAVTPAAVEPPPGAGISYQDYLKAKGQR